MTLLLPGSVLPPRLVTTESASSNMVRTKDADVGTAIDHATGRLDAVHSGIRRSMTITSG